LLVPDVKEPAHAADKRCNLDCEIHEDMQYTVTISPYLIIFKQTCLKL
jgi:hypothetical protein